MRKAKGFTLVELVIVIVIIGVLSIVVVPIYKKYMRLAIATEGKALLKTIQTAEKIYYTEYAKYKAVNQTNFDRGLDVDARSNKYFTSFAITTDGDNFTATTDGIGRASGISLTLIDGKTSTPTLIDNGIND